MRGSHVADVCASTRKARPTRRRASPAPGRIGGQEVPARIGDGARELSTGYRARTTVASLMDDEMSRRWDYLAEGNARQARKRVSAKVLLRDEAGRVLLVDPSYKENWDLPGGMAEANESPRAAAEREVPEELGVTIKAGRVLVVDWVGPHGPWDDQIVFIFDAG